MWTDPHNHIRCHVPFIWAGFTRAKTFALISSKLSGNQSPRLKLENNWLIHITRDCHRFFCYFSFNFLSFPLPTTILLYVRIHRRQFDVSPSVSASSDRFWENTYGLYMKMVKLSRERDVIFINQNESGERVKSQWETRNEKITYSFWENNEDYRCVHFELGVLVKQLPHDSICSSRKNNSLGDSLDCFTYWRTSSNDGDPLFGRTNNKNTWIYIWVSCHSLSRRCTQEHGSSNWLQVSNHAFVSSELSYCCQGDENQHKRGESVEKKRKSEQHAQVISRLIKFLRRAFWEFQGSWCTNRDLRDTVPQLLVSPLFDRNNSLSTFTPRSQPQSSIMPPIHDSNRQFHTGLTGLLNYKFVVILHPPVGLIFFSMSTSD